MKSFLKKILFAEMILAGVLVFSIGFSAPAQTTATQITPGTTGSNAPAQGIGGPGTGVTKQALDSALSPETRQTLAEAMKSVDPTAMVASGPANVLTVEAGEGAVLDETGVHLVSADSLPQKLKDALAAQPF